MDFTRQLRKNSTLSFFSVSVRILTNAIMFIGIARIYGPEIFGSFTAAFVLSTIFVLIADFGFETLLTTEISKNREKAFDIFQRYATYKILFCILALLSTWLIPIFYPSRALTNSLIYILSFSMMFTSLTNFFFAFFRGLERFRNETQITFIINLLLLFALIIAGVLKFNILYIALIFIITRGIGLLLAYIQANKIVSLSNVKLSLTGFSYKRKNILIFGFSLIFGNLFFQLITPLLYFFKNEYEVGIFESVFKLVGLVMIFSDIIVNATLPILSNYFENNRSQWEKLAYLLNKIYCLIAIPISLIFFFYGEQIITLLYGQNNFNSAIPLTKFAGLVIFIRFISETYGLMLTTSNKQFIRMVITAIGTSLTLLLSIFILPKQGSYGAAIVALIVNALVGIGYVVQNSKFFVIWTLDKHYIIPIISSIILSILTFEFVNSTVWYFSLIMFIISYTFIVLFIGFSKDERIALFNFKSEIIKI